MMRLLYVVLSVTNYSHIRRDSKRGAPPEERRQTIQHNRGGVARQLAVLLLLYVVRL